MFYNHLGIYKFLSDLLALLLATVSLSSLSPPECCILPGLAPAGFSSNTIQQATEILCLK